MHTRHFLALLLFLGLASAPASAADPAPPEKEPVVELGFSHGRICLNGVWNFQPATGAAAKAPQDAAWGTIRVPGTWVPRPRNNFPTIEKKGTGPTWANWEGNQVNQAWYERPIEIPREWAGRTILLDIRRVSTDATVYVNGKEAGEVFWPSGRVDLTPLVKAGGTFTLRVLVSATLTQKKTLNAMGVGQNTLVDATLATRGLIGEVFLASRPKGARIDSVWVRTSVRKHELAVDMDLKDVAGAGPVDVTATVRNKAGQVAKEFRGRVEVKPGDSTVSLQWPWADPELWDVGRPNLYTMELRAKGAGMDAGLAQTFGFREVWVEGRNIYLNGSLFRVRPTSSLPEGEYDPSNGNREVLEKGMRNILDAGFNCVELWPSDNSVRGSYHFYDLICEIGDHMGLPLMGPTRHAAEMFGSWEGAKWNQPEARKEWQRLLEEDWKNYRNNPSIIIWASSGNLAGHVDDQNPRRIGRGIEDPAWKEELNANAGWWKHMTRIQEMVDWVTALDPTRPYMIHQGGAVGDIYSLNNYLCLIPLQEREEWLSDWAQNGTKPYCAVEFGTPLSTTMNRGRDGFVFSTTTEWLMTEFAAIYFGREAYALEEPVYRNAISGPKYQGGQLWSWPDEEIMNFAPAFQRLEALFIENTWRSWRTMGTTGGMIPWSTGHGFRALKNSTPMPAFHPGLRGTWFANMAESAFAPFGGPGTEVTLAGKALLENNGPTLAWIAGDKKDGDFASFTNKDHSFVMGEKVSKQIVLLNDSRNAQPWKVTTSVTLEGRPLAKVEKSGTLAIGETLFVPLEFQIPPDGTDKQSGKIVLDAKIGESAHADTFAFRAFPPLKPLEGSVRVVDPAGETTKLLEKLGLTVKPWDGGAADLLVLGRKALSDGASLPGNLEDFVRQGGRLVIMAQDPSWMKEYLGFRISALLSRRMFPVDGSLPILAGLDALDLRDWSGSSTLVDGKPDYIRTEGAKSMSPPWGWRWGGRGAVSSAALEKPHRSGWRPLLEGEFDLAYSPLMELDFGKGRVLLCTLDLEDHATLDPAAALMARNLFEQALKAPLSQGTVQALYVGGDEGAALLNLIGLDYRRAGKVDASAPFVVLGPDVSADAAKDALAAGAKVLVLPRRQPGPAGLGITALQKDAFGGSTSVPAWHEARGLSPSDLRWRCDDKAILLEGRETGADGLLARVSQGKGVAIFSQSDPITLPADAKQYLRFTRWRMTRTLAQIAANLGGSFKQDARIFRAASKRILLDGAWKVAWTSKMAPSSEAFPDPGMTEEAEAMVKTDADETRMTEITLPSFWAPMATFDGEAVFRRHFTVPPEMLSKPLVVNLGVVDDFDSTFINGVKVGSIGAETKNYYSTPRIYEIPAGLLKAGENVIAVRVLDNYMGGGISGSPEGMSIAPAAATFESLYHPDYRSDFKLGDDPYRYYRW